MASVTAGVPECCLAARHKTSPDHAASVAVLISSAVRAALVVVVAYRAGRG